MRLINKEKKKSPAIRPSRGPISPTTLSKKGPIGYKHSLPNASSPNKVMTASGDSPAFPQGGDGRSWVIPRNGRLVLPAPSWERPSCSQMVMSGGFTPPTTPGLRVPGFPQAAVPVPKRPTKGCLRERCRVLPQRPGSHFVPSSLYEDIIRGLRSHLCTRRLEDQTTGASRWTL